MSTWSPQFFESFKASRYVCRTCFYVTVCVVCCLNEYLKKKNCTGGLYACIRFVKYASIYAFLLYTLLFWVYHGKRKFLLCAILKYNFLLYTFKPSCCTLLLNTLLWYTTKMYTFLFDISSFMYFAYIFVVNVFVTNVYDNV